jgi:hypothetical protein
MNIQFYQLAIGAEFEFRGRRYRKLAMSMAEDELRCGNVFQAGYEVVSEGPLLPAEVAERWTPSDIPWTDYLTPAPGQEPNVKREM